MNYIKELPLIVITVILIIKTCTIWAVKFVHVIFRVIWGFLDIMLSVTL